MRPEEDTLSEGEVERQTEYLSQEQEGMFEERKDPDRCRNRAQGRAAWKENK